MAVQQQAFRRLRLYALLLLLATMQQMLMASDVHAQARAFTQRFNTNDNGDIRLIGNTVKTCDSTTVGAVGQTTCVAARTATDTNNDNGSYAIIDVNVDGAPNFNSSTAILSLPAGSTVLFAGLYWGARSASVGRGQVLFRTPGSGGYAPVTASIVDTGGGGASNNYQAFADVTAQVAAGGNGTYGVANIQANNGNDGNGFWGGWSLVIAYKNLGDTLKNLAVYDGYQVIVAAGTVTITPSGFLTPLSGTVNARVGFVVYDGDPGPGAFALGEQVTINGTVLSNAANPVNDVMNSTISDLGTLIGAGSRNPFDRNTFGLDVDRFSVPAGVIPNGATSATVTMSSAAGGEVYYPQVLTTAIELYVPIITPNVTKTVTDLNGGALVPGDALRWTISLSNTGVDTGTNVILKDPIPANTTFVSNSLVIATGANSGAKTNGSGDDQAEFSNVPATCAPVASPCVIFRLGTGANAVNGGNLPQNASTSVQFDTTVNAGVTSGTSISNSATISYSGQTLGSTFSTSSSAASLVVQVPPLISKSFSANPIAVNGTSVLTIVVSSPASSPTTMTGVTFSDTYPAGLVNTASPSPAVSCSPGATAGSITGGASGGNTIGMTSATLPAGTNCTVTVNVTSAVAGNYTNTTGTVSSTNAGTGGTATATLGVGKPAISKSFSVASILANGTATVTFTLTNPTAVPLTTVAFSDSLVNMQVAAVPGVTNTCGGAVTAVAGSASINLANGALGAAPGSCTITVNVTSNTTGVQPNTTSGVTSTETGAAGPPSNTPTLTVIGAAVAAKSFSPTSIQTTGVNAGAASTLTITITNPNSTLTMTGVSFTDTYPANVINASVPNPTLSCTIGSSATPTGGTAGGNTVGMVGGTIAPGGVCTINVRVSSNTVGNYNNMTGTVTSTNAGNGAAANATLNVSNLTPPTVAKSFAPTTIASGGTSVLMITLTNPNAAASPVTGVAFGDIYPSGVFNTAAPAPTPTCTGTGIAGTATAAANGGSVSLSGTTIAGGGTCTVTVNVTSSSVGVRTNTLPAGSVTTTNAAVNTTVANANLTVLTPPTIAKAFSPSAIGTGAASFSTLTITLTNPAGNPASLTGINFTDNFPANVIVHTTPTTSNTCGGTYTDAGGGAIGSADTGIRLTGVTLAAGASCAVTVLVRSNSTGTYNNTTGAVAATGPVALTGSTASATLAVGLPGVTKSFATSPILAGASSVMTITLSNATAAAMTAAAFTDTYPNTMTNAAAPAAATTCGGSVTAAANGPSVALSAGTIPANGSCTVTVTVTATTTTINTIAAGALTTSAGNNATAATATLVVTPPLTIAKSFSPSTIEQGGTTLLTITLTNLDNFNVTGVAFTDNYPNSPAQMRNTAAPAGATTCSAGTVTAAANGTSLAFSAGTVPANSSCTITVNVTAPTAGSYVNSSGNVTTTNAGASPAVSATLTVQPPPSVTKLVQLISDPINGAINPRSIPRAIVEYTVLVSNSTVALTTDSVVIADAIPATLALCVNATCGAPAGIVSFANGVTSSGLTYTVGTDVTYSNTTTPAVFTYTPAPNAAGCDPNVAVIRVNPKGVFASGVGINPQPSFSLRFRGCIK